MLRPPFLIAGLCGSPYLLICDSARTESANSKGDMDKEDILLAIDHDRLFLLLQPIVTTLTRRTVFHEGLLRLRTETGDVLNASDFILDAERYNIVRDVDRRALQLAIVALEKHRGFDIAVNISSPTTADFSWVQSLDELTLDRRGVVRRLIVEITETAAIEDINRTISFIDSLKELGARVAIDDYGAGHTNFTNLNLFAPDIVKIDSSYVQKYREPNARKFLEGLVDLSQTLAFETVAEGVETEACAQAMSGLGVTYMQGYLFGAPALPEQTLANSKSR